MNIVALKPPLNHRPRPKSTVVDTIVLHATAGSSLAGAIETLRERHLGYHYLIEKDGTITKALPNKRQTGHAGNSYGPHEEATGVTRKQVFVKGKGWMYVADSSVNSYSIGISFVNLNDGSDPFTTEQFEACRELIGELRTAMPELKFITTHYGVSHRRKSDPMGFDILRLSDAVGLTPWKVSEARWPPSSKG